MSLKGKTSVFVQFSLEENKKIYIYSAMEQREKN